MPVAVTSARQKDSNLPFAAQKIVSEITTPDRDEAFRQGWIDLATTEIDGVVWQRPTGVLSPSSNKLMRLSGHLEAVASKLNESFCKVTDPSRLQAQVKELIEETNLPRWLPPSSEEMLDLFSEEIAAMYAHVSAMSGTMEAALNIRVEQKEGFALQYHRDLGTTLMISLLGPGTLFTSASNIPDNNQRASWPEQLKDPRAVFEVPTLSMLMMRGRSNTGSGGLWHASPTGFTHRVLLIVTTPSSTILPHPEI